MTLLKLIIRELDSTGTLYKSVTSSNPIYYKPSFYACFQTVYSTNIFRLKFSMNLSYFHLTTCLANREVFVFISQKVFSWGLEIIKTPLCIIILSALT